MQTALDNAYLQHYNRYRNNPNPKIADAWTNIKRGIGYGLFLAADSTMERVAAEYAAGYFDPSVSTEIAQGLFTYWGGIGAIQPMLGLLQVPENAEYIGNEMQITTGPLFSSIPRAPGRIMPPTILYIILTINPLLPTMKRLTETPTGLTRYSTSF